MHHEGAAETGTESDFRFLAEADLSAGDLAGVAGDEVVDGLVGREARDRRHDAAGVARQEDHVARMAGHLGRQIVLDIIERIGAARVFGDQVVVEVETARDWIDHDVFENSAEAARAGMDLRLGFGRETNDFGVTAVLEVEDAVLAPAMLVVADQLARGVGRERGLAGTGEAEEERRIAIRADVGGAVHGQHALQRKQEIEHREDGLLDLAAVTGAADDGQPLGKVDEDEGLGAGAVDDGGGLERGRADHGELGRVALEFIGALDLHEHVACEQAVPGLLGWGSTCRC